MVRLSNLSSNRRLQQDNNNHASAVPLNATTQPVNNAAVGQRPRNPPFPARVSGMVPGTSGDTPLANPSASPEVLFARRVKQWKKAARWGEANGRACAAAAVISAVENKSTSLNLQGLYVSSLPPLPEGLVELKVGHNKLTTLPDNLPVHLESLEAFTNKLSHLPPLPEKLTELWICRNPLRTLPDNLPGNLKTIWATHNLLSHLPRLPQSLTCLTVSNNLLNHLPQLPQSLTYLDVRNNQLNRLPQLPQGLGRILVDYNELTALPDDLPVKLSVLSANNNQLSHLPQLPQRLLFLKVNNNQLTALPESLPIGLHSLSAHNNQLSHLPRLPQNLRLLEQHTEPHKFAAAISPQQLLATQRAAIPAAQPTLPIAEAKITAWQDQWNNIALLTQSNPAAFMQAVDQLQEHAGFLTQAANSHSLNLMIAPFKPTSPQERAYYTVFSHTMEAAFVAAQVAQSETFALVPSPQIAVASAVASAVGNTVPVVGPLVIAGVAVATNAAQGRIHADTREGLANFQACFDRMQDCHTVTQNVVRTVCQSYREGGGAKFGVADNSSTASNTWAIALMQKCLKTAGLTFENELFASPQGLAASKDAAKLINTLTDLDNARRNEFRALGLQGKTDYLVQELGVSAAQIDATNSPQHAAALPQQANMAVSTRPAIPELTPDVVGREELTSLEQQVRALTATVSTLTHQRRPVPTEINCAIESRRQLQQIAIQLKANCESEQLFGRDTTSISIQAMIDLMLKQLNTIATDLNELPDAVAERCEEIRNDNTVTDSRVARLEEENARKEQENLRMQLESARREQESARREQEHARVIMELTERVERNEQMQRDNAAQMERQRNLEAQQGRCCTIS